MATAIDNSDRVRGRRVRLSWLDGPTRGAIHEHHFHRDGTVEWHAVDENGRAKDNATTKNSYGVAPERARYAAMRASENVCLVSYLARSGYTLTVALNFTDGSSVGAASNGKEWYAVRGRFEIVLGGADERVRARSVP